MRRPPPPRSFRPRARSRSGPPPRRPRTASSGRSGRARRPTYVHTLAAQARGDRLLVQARALDRVSRVTIPSRSPATRARPGAGADPQLHGRHPAPVRVAQDGVEDRAGERELVHSAYAWSAQPATFSSTTSTARPTASSTGARAPAHLPDLSRLARDDHDLARPAADRLDEPQHALRVHRVRVEGLAVLDAALDRPPRRAPSRTASRAAALAADVDEHKRVVAAHDLVGEVQSAGAEVDRPRRPRAARFSQASGPRGRRSRRRRGTRCRCRPRGSAAAGSDSLVMRLDLLG